MSLFTLQTDTLQIHLSKLPSQKKNYPSQCDSVGLVSPTNGEVAGSIPSQGTCLGCRSIPSWGVYKGIQSMFLSHINVSLRLSLPPFLSKIRNNKIFKKHPVSMYNYDLCKSLPGTIIFQNTTFIEDDTVFRGGSHQSLPG